MSVAYIGQSQAQPEAVEAFRRFMTEVVAPAVTASDGCQGYQIFQSETDPTQFIGVELWASVDAHRGAVKNIDPASIAEYMQLVAAPPTGGYYRLV
jgi:quinol monooxygenase YgiN